jgi:hypothetical protein
MGKANLTGNVLVMNASSPEHYPQTVQAISDVSSAVTVVKQDAGSPVGLRRLEGLRLALEVNNSHLAVVQNADGHHSAQAITSIVRKLASYNDSNADMFVGVRHSFREMADKLLAAQVSYENIASNMVAQTLSLTDICMEDGIPDLLSGCSAFTAKGWQNYLEKIRPFISEKSPLQSPAGFDLGMPALFRWAGLKVVPVEIEIESRVATLTAEELRILNANPALWAKRGQVAEEARTLINFISALNVRKA